MSSETIEIHYLSGFGNEFATESYKGTLPVGQNSPQHVPFGLYPEVISGTSFTTPRFQNRRTWMYRIRPSSVHAAFKPLNRQLWSSPPFDQVKMPPNRMRWDPLPLPDPDRRIDLIEGMTTYAGNGSVEVQAGCAVHVFAANASMQRVFCDSDGELLLLPQQGRLLIETELGRLLVAPGELVLVPRGLKFRVKLPDGSARGYVCENFGNPFRLPELGPIGSNGLANARDFESPIAWFEDRAEPTELVCKFLGGFWTTTLDRSPFDVVAWHGNNAPYRYDLSRFMVISTVSFDHADPSILTVLTSPSETPGTANVDFVIFPPRWIVAEHTFRPPWYHRNIMSEFMGLIRGVYDAKPEGFIPGGASLHNCMTAHGPDHNSYERAIVADLKPQFLGDTLAFMFESRLALKLTRESLEAPTRQLNYDDCWSGVKAHFKPPAH